MKEFRGKVAVITLKRVDEASFMSEPFLRQDKLRLRPQRRPSPKGDLLLCAQGAHGVDCGGAPCWHYAGRGGY
jgi:hypothetical protein